MELWNKQSFSEEGKGDCGHSPMTLCASYVDFVFGWLLNFHGSLIVSLAPPLVNLYSGVYFSFFPTEIQIFVQF